MKATRKNWRSEKILEQLPAAFGSVLVLQSLHCPLYRKCSTSHEVTEGWSHSPQYERAEVVREWNPRPTTVSHCLLESKWFDGVQGCRGSGSPELWRILAIQVVYGFGFGTVLLDFRGSRAPEFCHVLEIWGV